MMEKVDCPYCSGKIPSDAQVCQHCGRDVGRLIRAEAEIAELKALIGDVDKKVAQEGEEGREELWSTAAPISLFYLISIFIFLAGIPNYPYDNYAFYSLGFLVGLIIVGMRDDYNLWKLFFIGFIQPSVLISAVLLYKKLDFYIIKVILDDMVLLALKLGLVTSLGGIVIAAVFYILKKRPLNKELFSFTPIIEFIRGAGINLSGLKVALGAIGSLITTVLFLLDKLGLFK